jgi:hypothetical protein
MFYKVIQIIGLTLLIAVFSYGGYKMIKNDNKRKKIIKKLYQSNKKR